MKQQFQNELEQEQKPTLERSIGNVFEEWLVEHNKPTDAKSFAEYSEKALVVIDGSTILNSSGRGMARVVDMLRLVVKPTQVIDFQPILAGG